MIDRFAAKLGQVRPYVRRVYDSLRHNDERERK